MRLSYFFSSIILALCLVVQVSGQSIVPDLDATLRVNYEKSGVTCTFMLPGKVDQSFKNTEYRYSILNSEGIAVDVGSVNLPLRTILLPRSQRSVTDRTDLRIDNDQLTPGEEYYVVVRVRNLIGLDKFVASKAKVAKDEKPTPKLKVAAKLYEGTSEDHDFHEALDLAIAAAKVDLQSNLINWEFVAMTGVDGGFILAHTLKVVISAKPGPK